MNNALKSCKQPASVLKFMQSLGTERSKLYIRITLKSRAAIAAAAIVQRMIMRSRPLVFLLVTPRKSGSTGVVAAAAMMANAKDQKKYKEKEKLIAVASMQLC